MADSSSIGFLDRTLTQLRNAWNNIARHGDVVRPDLPDDDLGRVRAMMAECLEGKGGEVSARARAADLGRAYLTLDGTGRGRFLRLLATAFDVDREAVETRPWPRWPGRTTTGARRPRPDCVRY